MVFKAEQGMEAALPQAFVHGGGVEAMAKQWQCAVSEILDLSTGLHPAGAPAWLPEWLKAHAALAARYPDAMVEPARSVLADAMGVAAEHMLITAGAQAVIEVVFQAMGWRSLAIEVPCYNEPIRCALRAGCQLRPYASGEIMPVADALWHTSPSNPSGQVRSFPEGVQGVVDESYLPFAERCRTGLKDGLIRLGSLTKLFCIPGLRLGYVIADAATIRRLQQWMPPWPVPTPSLHLLPALLAEADERDRQVVQARERLVSLLEQHHWQVVPSQASFVLARCRGEVPDFAAQRILLRSFPEWPQLAGWLRFGLPGDAMAWQRLQEALCRSH